VKRSPATNPQPGDVLSYGAYTVKVDAREGDLVRYTKTRPARWEGFFLAQEAITQPASQDLREWALWTPRAKVVSMSGSDDPECVVFEFAVAGPCKGCRKWADHDRHTVVAMGVFCGECCPASKHTPSRTTKKAKGMAA